MRQHQETMRLLLTSMGCQWVLASSLEEGIWILSRGPAAAAVMDSGIASSGSHRKNDKIQHIVKCVADRVILVFGETREPQVTDLAP
jgi:hypothetical protein